MLDAPSVLGYHLNMKFTQYFLHTHERPDRRDIRIEWIERVISHPIKEAVQTDGRIKKWGKIPEAGGKYLRVVLLEDGKTVHNAFLIEDFGR
jgi:hypothetical protein